jgi:hypothetical protein
MSPITTTIEVDRPAEDVFAYVTNPTRFVEWQHGVVSGDIDGDGAHQIGDLCVTTRKIGGPSDRSPRRYRTSTRRTRGGFGRSTAPSAQSST